MNPRASWFLDQPDPGRRTESNSAGRSGARDDEFDPDWDDGTLKWRLIIWFLLACIVLLVIVRLPAVASPAG